MIYSGPFNQIRQRQGLSLDLFMVSSSILPIDNNPLSSTSCQVQALTHSKSMRQAEPVLEAELTCCGSKNTGFSHTSILSSGDSTNWRVALPFSSVEQSCTKNHLPRQGLFLSTILLCPGGVRVTCSTHRISAEAVCITSEPRTLMHECLFHFPFPHLLTEALKTRGR